MHQPSVVSLLLEKGADPKIVNSMNVTALHLACEYQPSVVLVLLEKGADPNVKNQLGFKPMDLTANPSVIQALLKAGAIPSRLSQWKIRRIFPECIPLMERALHTKGE
jgi:ankyrin repeat protein